MISPVSIQEVDVCPAVEVNPQALACGGVVVVLGPQAGEGASLSLGAVVADMNHPLRLP